MTFTKFPFETDMPRVDVVLPAGTHVLKLVVEDDAGTLSQPDTVVFCIAPIPPPTIQSITSDSFVRAETAHPILYGEHLQCVTSIKIYRNGQEDDQIIVDTRSQGTDNRLPITITILSQACEGLRHLVVTTAGGAATIPIKVLSAAKSPAEVGIVLLTLSVATLHIVHSFPNILSILSGVGYIVILAALYANPISKLIAGQHYQRRWVLIGYTLLIIVVWVAVGERGQLVYITKVLETFLLLLLFVESWQPDRT